MRFVRRHRIIGELHHTSQSVLSHRDSSLERSHITHCAVRSTVEKIPLDNYEI